MRLAKKEKRSGRLTDNANTGAPFKLQNEGFLITGPGGNRLGSAMQGRRVDSAINKKGVAKLDLKAKGKTEKGDNKKARQWNPKARSKRSQPNLPQSQLQSQHNHRHSYW